MASEAFDRTQNREELMVEAARCYEMLGELHWQESYCWPISAQDQIRQVGMARTAKAAAQTCRMSAAALRRLARRRGHRHGRGAAR